MFIATYPASIVREENGRKHSIDGHDGPRAGQELLDLVEQTLGIADGRVIIARQLNISGVRELPGKMPTHLDTTGAIAHPMQQQARRPDRRQDWANV